MAIVKPQLSSAIKLFGAFALAFGLLTFESRGAIQSKLAFLTLPALGAYFSASNMLPIVVHFIVLFEMLLVSVFWPVSLLSKALIMTTMFWYLQEFPQHAIRNLVFTGVILCITIASAPVVQQF
ncbi:hypothetical protein HY065_00700 [Candidatus Berkelbacteria bacterium]|nr:hypothetical protein [Candidatus Berkelbacteria bacterium]